jgi:hypothetical protein
MTKNKIGKFFAKLRFKLFMFRRDQEVHQIFAQLQGRRDGGFPFATAAQMNQQTQARDLRAMLDLIAEQSPEMGRAYGEAFCYLMHRDIYERLELYVMHIQQNIPHESRLPVFAS